MRRQLVVVILAAFVGDGAAAQPQDAGEPAAQATTTAESRDFALWLSRATSDNVARLDAGGRGSYDALGMLFDIGRQSQRLESHFNANVEFRRYSDDSLENEPVGTVDGLLNVGLIIDRLVWGFQETYGQTRIDPFTASGPLNRESLNEFTTGPELDLPLGASTRLSAAARRSTRSFDETDGFDNDATVYELGLFRQARETTRYGLLWTTNEVEYEVAGVPTYEIDRTSLHYERVFSTGGVSIDVGTNELTFLGTSTDEPLFNFEWSRDLGTRSTLRVLAAREFSDTSASLRADLNQIPVGSDTRVFVSSSPFEQQRLFVTYSVGGARTNVTIGLGTSEDSYVGDSSLDSDNTTANASFRRTVTSRLNFGVDLYRVDREFPASAAGPARDDTDETIGAWVNRSIGRLFGLAFILSRYERGADAESFEENRYEIRFTYSPSRSATAALGTVSR